MEFRNYILQRNHLILYKSPKVYIPLLNILQVPTFVERRSLYNYDCWFCVITCHSLLGRKFEEGRSVLSGGDVCFNDCRLSDINLANLEPFVSLMLFPIGVGVFGDTGGINAHTEERCSLGLSRSSKIDKSFMSARNSKGQ